MRKIALALLFAGLVGCQNNDEEVTQASVMDQLTAGGSRSWKIESATLQNGSDALTITGLANVKDDEFVFSAASAGSAKLNWNIRNQVRATATTTQEALLDYYLSGLERALTVQSDGTISSDDPNLAISRGTNGTFSVQYQMSGSQLFLELTPVVSTAAVPALLSLEFITDIETTSIGLEQAAGFTGSMASNSLYLSYRASLGGTPNVVPERVIRYDMDDGTFTTRDFINPDFVTKEIHIINDELKVVGAQFVNSYPLDLSSDPVSVPHNLTITRYGSTVVDDNVFLFGGDLSFPGPDQPGPNADKIYRHDQATGQLHEVGTLPEPRYWAHGEIVDGKLYVFGGRQAFISDQAESDIFVHDMTTGENRALTLPTPMHRTFAARYGHLIYVAGYRDIPNADPALSTIETTFGVFDTHTETFTVIPSTFTFAGKETIFGLTIVGDQLYALVGTWGVTTFSIYRAPLSGI